MSATDYDPIPRPVREAFAAFVAAAADAGFRVRDHLLHSDEPLEQGQDVSVGDDVTGYIARYWPGVSTKGLYIASRSPLTYEEWDAACALAIRDGR